MCCGQAQYNCVPSIMLSATSAVVQRRIGGRAIPPHLDPAGAGVGSTQPDLERGSIGLGAQSASTESIAPTDADSHAESLGIPVFASPAQDDRLEYPQIFVPEPPSDPLVIDDDAVPDLFIPHVSHDQLDLRLPRKGWNIPPRDTTDSDGQSITVSLAIRG